jgi:hypothetical protein
MSLTITNVKRSNMGNRRVRVFNAAFDSSYPTGGEVLSPASIGLRHIDEVFISNPVLLGYQLSWDRVNKKILVYQGSGVKRRLVTQYHAGTSQVTDEAATSQTVDSAACVGSAAAPCWRQLAAVAGGPTWAVGAVGTAAAYIPRNARIVFLAPGGGCNLYEGTAVYTLTGTWRGAAQTENITVTNALANKAVAAANYRWTEGVKPFDTITGCTIDSAAHLPDVGCQIGVGIGARIGLHEGLADGTTASFRHAAINEALIASAPAYCDATNETYNCSDALSGDIPAAAEILLNYWAGGEVPDTKSLAALTGVQCMAIGW